MKKVKKNIFVGLSVFIITFLIIASNFLIHCISVNHFNSVKRTVASNYKQAKIEIDIHPRGLKTDSWPNEEAFPDKTIFGSIYELNVRNSLGYKIDDWALRINVYQNCYLNNAWCGMVEVHQFRDGAEIIQQLDLQTCDVNDIMLEYVLAYQDILISLQEGDYFVYYPSRSACETPIASSKTMSETVTAGFIVYTEGDIESFDYSDATIEYYAAKNYFEGAESTIFIILMPLWAVCFMIFIVFSILFNKYERRLRDKDKTVIETIGVFSSFVDAKDPYTNGHSNRVAIYSKLIAEKLGFSQSDCKNIYYMGLLHDIGKCYVPDDILKKPEELTEDQNEGIKIHTIKGAEMLKNFTSIPNITYGVLYHHERYDGNGYPYGKKGKDIPIEGRIICVADAFDAMNTDRCYRERLSKTEIIEQLQKYSGSQFDPMVVNAFLEVINEENGISF